MYEATSNYLCKLRHGGLFRRDQESGVMEPMQAAGFGSAPLTTFHHGFGYFFISAFILLVSGIIFPS